MTKTARNDEETIVALATAPGHGAIAVVRLSGPRSGSLLKQHVQPMAVGGSVNPFPHRRLVLGEFVSTGADGPLDQVMAVFFKPPHSYTGEAMAEIHCHGSPAVIGRILDTLIRAGARPAAPGEFTRRAFLNGRIDLAQAEAVCDLVRSDTDAAARTALRQLAGGLSKRIEEIRAGLIGFAAEIEARLDFPDEDLDPADRSALMEGLGGTADALAALLRQGRRGRVQREGIRIVLVGRPNVGKSSLLNALVGRERALVSPHPGTTRDTVETTIDLEGIAATLVDTAGWRAARDEIERMGVERTETEVATADLLLWIVDGSQPLNEEDRRIAARVADLPAVVVCNKSDLPNAIEDETLRALGFPDDRVCRLSALRGRGIETLEDRIVVEILGDRPIGGEPPLVSNARHLALIERAAEAVGRARKAFGGGVSGDLVMVDIRIALGAVDELVGRTFDEEVLDAIFARFCIGK